MRNAASDKHEVAGCDRDAVKHIEQSILRLESRAPLLARNAGLEAEIDASIRRSTRQEIPALRLADRRTEETLRARHLWMCLNDEPLVAVQELHEKRQITDYLPNEPPVFYPPQTFGLNLLRSIERRNGRCKPVLWAEHFR